MTIADWVARGGEPIVDRSVMTLDGTLFVDAGGKPWLVYAHEWVQIGDGTIEAMPLKDDLSAAGPPRVARAAYDWRAGA